MLYHDTYYWFKAFHLIFMVAWFAGLFYIFRLFVYHVHFKEKSEITSAYEVMEKKLLYMIMHPAMFFTLLFGVLMIVKRPGLLKEGWLHQKFGLILFLIGYQIFASVVRKRFSRGDYFISERACRIINEVPSVLLIGIVLLAIFKP